MNKKDLGGALVLIGLFAAMTAVRAQYPTALEGLLFLGRPLSTALITGGVVVLYCYKYHATALVAGLLSVYLLKTMWVTWPRSAARRLHLEVGRDHARWNTIDLQFANGSVTHSLPHMISPPAAFPELLVFPPSAEVQSQMNGD